MECPRPERPTPNIDYTARDYATLRRLLLDRATLTTPGWVERHVPDLGVTLVEALAYVGDQISYQQDAVATEAYLDTARRRESVRRHVRLIDYAMHDGCNARAWVALDVDRPVTVEPAQLRFAAVDVSRVEPRERPELPTVISEEELDTLPPGTRHEIFEPVAPAGGGATSVELVPAHNTIRFWTWGDGECCLPAGATSATLRDVWEDGRADQPRGGGHDDNDHDHDHDHGDDDDCEPERSRQLKLRAGDVILIEEVMGPRTGAAADADPARRHAVRLTAVTPGVDRVYDQPVLEVTWDEADALPTSVCVSSRGGPECQELADVSVVRGNVLLVDHGRDLGRCDRPPEVIAVPPAQVPTPTCEQPDFGCADGVDEHPALAALHRLLAAARAGRPAAEEDIADLARAVGPDAVDRAGLLARDPAERQAAALETLLAQVTYPSWRRRFRPLLERSPVTQRVVYPGSGHVSGAQARLLATIAGRARARVDELWRRVRDRDDHDNGHDDHGHDHDDHGHDHDHDDRGHDDHGQDHDDHGHDHGDHGDGGRRRLRPSEVAELRDLFGDAVLAEVRLTERPTRALRELAARFDTLLAAKLRRLSALLTRARAGEVLAEGIAWEIRQTWGESYADGLSPGDPRLAGPAVAAVVQDPRSALPAVEVRGYLGDQPVGVWAPRRDLLSSGPRDRHLVGELTDTGRLALRFGDGTHGAPPPAGGELRVRYRVGNGVPGNVGADAIRHIVRCGGPVLGGVTAVRNPIPATGGTDPEAVDQVRQLAPLALRRERLRAVTAADYAELAGRVPGVSRAAARIRWTGAGDEVHVAVDPAGAAVAGPELVQAVADALERYRRIGHDLMVRPAILVPVEIALTVCVDPGFQRGNVRDAVRRALGPGMLPGGRLGFFHPDALTFGEPVRVSRLIAVAAAVPGVLSVQVTRLRRLFRPDDDELAAGLLTVGALEIAQLDNDPGRPENGLLTVTIGGGR